MKPHLTHILGFFALSALLCQPALAQTAPMQRTITVSGEINEQVPPDQAILSVSLVSKDRDLNVAKKNNDALTEKVAHIAHEFKIPKEKIATSNLYIAPEYNYNNKENKQIFVGYTVNRSLRITMDDLAIHERLLSAMIDAKVDQVNGVEFLLSNPEAHAGPLRVKAFENAKAKAAALTQAAGAKLGPALTISTGGISTSIPGPRPMMTMAKMTDSAEISVAPSLPGMVELRQSVTVVFGME